MSRKLNWSYTYSRRQLALVLLFCFCVACGGYKLFVRPSKEELVAIQQAINMQSKMGEREKSLESIFQQIESSTSSANVVQDITHMAKHTSVEVMVIKPEGQKQLNGFYWMPLQLKVVGSFYHMWGFINAIIHSSLFYKFNYILVKKNSRGVLFMQVKLVAVALKSFGR